MHVFAEKFLFFICFRDFAHTNIKIFSFSENPDRQIENFLSGYTNRATALILISQQKNGIEFVFFMPTFVPLYHFSY